MKCLFLFAALILTVNITYSQSTRLLDQNNGFKDFKLGNAISDYPQARKTRIGFRCGITNYPGCNGKIKTKEDWESWGKYIKTYIVTPQDLTLFNEPVEGILLTVVNGKVIRIIVRVYDLNIAVLEGLFGKEDKYETNQIKNCQTWLWNGKNVELWVRDNIYDPLYKRDWCVISPIEGGYDLIFFSKEMANYFDDYMESIKDRIKNDF